MAQQLKPGSVPPKLKNRGKSVLNKRNALTVQGVAVSARVRVLRTRGDMPACSRVIRGPQRLVTFVSSGRCNLRVKVSYTAPGTTEYLPLRKTFVYKVKRVR